MTDGPFRDNNLDSLRRELAMATRENELLHREKEHYRTHAAKGAFFTACRYTLAATSLGALMVTGNGWCLLIGILALARYSESNTAQRWELGTGKDDGLGLGPSRVEPKQLPNSIGRKPPTSSPNPPTLAPRSPDPVHLELEGEAAFLVESDEHPH